MATLYLCGFAALDILRYLRATNAGTIPGRMTRTRRMRNPLHAKKQLNELPHSAQLMLTHVQGKIEAMVPEHNYVTNTPELVTHEWTHDLPSSAFIDLGNGIYLSSPPFVFLQIASKLPEVQLIALGMELCGFYSRWKEPDFRLSNTVKDEFKAATYDIQPVTTAQKLMSFVSLRKGNRGARAARTALHRVLNNSASPMETAVYLLLCLPRHQGGWGMPSPVLNARVHVTASTTHENRFPDLYWPSKGLDVEYQSDYAHTGNWARYRDSRREVELEAEKVTVLPLTKKQLLDAEEFRVFAIGVRRLLGKRSRTMPADWWSKYLDLREALLWTS